MADPIESAEAFADTLIAGHLQAEFLIEARDAALTAAVREPLERQLSESRKSAEHSHKLYTDLDAEVESALSKLAPFADEDQELTLTELADEAWNSWASTADELKNAEERIASLEAQLASAPRWIPVEERLPEYSAPCLVVLNGVVQAVAWSRRPTFWLAHTKDFQTAALDMFSHWAPWPKFPPPAAQKEPSRAEPARRCVYDGTPLEPGDTVCGACCCVQPAQKEPL